MKFLETRLPGVFEVHIEPLQDERGFFARTWCRREWEERNLNPQLVQCNVSFNPRKGTLRGMHYQADPFPEVKLVRCTQGAIYDVVVDLRTGSPTFRHWVAVELTARNRIALYIPAGCAHGLLTLEDDSEVFYQMSEFYHVDLSRGVRWDDPAFQISWPSTPAVISHRDRTYPNFEQ